MEGLLFWGLGGLAASGIALWHAQTSCEAYVARLKNAQPATLQTPQGTFVYVTGKTQCNKPYEHNGHLYVAIWQQLFQLSVVRNITLLSGNQYASHSTSRLLLSSNDSCVENILLGDNWDITAFKSALKISSAGEVPVVSPKTGSSNIMVNVQSQAAPPVLGENESEAVGYVTVTRGIRVGEDYTIFGCADIESSGSTVISRKLQVCPIGGRVVFRKKTAQQVISEAEQSLASWKWNWAIVGCASGVVTLAGVLTGLASRQ